MTFICGYCKAASKPPRQYKTWLDLIDHLINSHRFFRNEENKLERV
jgi:hypothetical protein